MKKDERAYQEFLPYATFPPFFSSPHSHPQLTPHSHYFTPSSEAENNVADEPAIDEEGKLDVEAQDGENAPLPDLPDVPTQEPTEDGQPSSKKVKLSGDVAEGEGGEGKL